MTRIKICGIKRSEDAMLAAELGAAAIGMIFSPSERKVSTSEARAICGSLPPFVDRVGVFVNPTIEEVLSAMESMHLTRVQLHGSERPESFRNLPGALTRAFAFDTADLERDIEQWVKHRPDVQILLDLPKNRNPEDPSLASVWSKAEALNRRRPVVLAGGLTPFNVEEALRAVRPAAVDVARGVESSPGVKDPELLRQFFARVHEFDRAVLRSTL